MTVSEIVYDRLTCNTANSKAIPVRPKAREHPTIMTGPMKNRMRNP